MNVTKETIEKALTVNTRAVMIVHYAGLPVEMDEILELGLPVIEDAAHAVASTYKGKPCGYIGDIGILTISLTYVVSKLSAKGVNTSSDSI